MYTFIQLDWKCCSFSTSIHQNKPGKNISKMLSSTAVVNIDNKKFEFFTKFWSILTKKKKHPGFSVVQYKIFIKSCGRMNRLFAQWCVALDGISGVCDLNTGTLWITQCVTQFHTDKQELSLFDTLFRLVKIYLYFYLWIIAGDADKDVSSLLGGIKSIRRCKKSKHKERLMQCDMTHY